MTNEIELKQNASFNETIDRISDVAKQTRQVGIDLLISLSDVIDENYEKSSQDLAEKTPFRTYVKERLDTIYQEHFGNKRRCRSKNIFKMLLTLVCFNAGYDIWGNKFSQFKMTYYNAYMRYNELSEEEKQAASSVQKLADEYKKGQIKNKSEESSPKNLQECLTKFLERHKKMLNGTMEPTRIILEGVTYTLSISK